MEALMHLYNQASESWALPGPTRLYPKGSRAQPILVPHFSPYLKNLINSDKNFEKLIIIYKNANILSQITY